MAEDQQAILSDEEADRELAEAEKEFDEQTKEETTIKKVDDTPLTKDILIALGFIRYDNKEKGIAYKLHVGPLQIGRTYNEKYPKGNMWVRCLKDCEYGKKGDFPTRDECKQIPQVAIFYRIRNGELPIPESVVYGTVVGKSEKAVQIQFDEFGLDQFEIQWWGFRALKKNEEGMNYVPASYSKETENYNAKMLVPRDIILEYYEAELAAAPLTTQTDTTKEKDAPKEKGDSQSTEKGTLAEAIHKESTALTEGEKATVPELIAKYVEILAQVTEAVKAEDRIKDREKGYGVKFVYYSVKGAIENGKGGDHEEQA